MKKKEKKYPLFRTRAHVAGIEFNVMYTKLIQYFRILTRKYFPNLFAVPYFHIAKKLTVFHGDSLRGVVIIIVMDVWHFISTKVFPFFLFFIYFGFDTVNNIVW